MSGPYFGEKKSLNIFICLRGGQRKCSLTDQIYPKFTLNKCRPVYLSLIFLEISKNTLPKTS